MVSRARCQPILAIAVLVLVGCANQAPHDETAELSGADHGPRDADPPLEARPASDETRPADESDEWWLHDSETVWAARVHAGRRDSELGVERGATHSIAIDIDLWFASPGTFTILWRDIRFRRSPIERTLATIPVSAGEQRIVLHVLGRLDEPDREV